MKLFSIKEKTQTRRRLHLACLDTTVPMSSNEPDAQSLMDWLAAWDIATAEHKPYKLLYDYVKTSGIFGRTLGQIQVGIVHGVTNKKTSKVLHY